MWTHRVGRLLASLAALPLGRLPGLLDAPIGDWLSCWLLWLPVFALVLAGLVRLFHPVEARRRR